MIEALDHRDPAVAREIYALQQASYAVERDLIGVADFPPLRVTAEEIQRETEVFLGYRDDEGLAGAISYERGPDEICIGRMIVHPRAFRRGVASALLEAVERAAADVETLTVSTAEKNLPAVRLYEKHGFRITARTTLPDGLVLVRLARSRHTGDPASRTRQVSRSDAEGGESCGRIGM
jgi:ribosomal protein S18 acetylase RimI-like enzyme